MHKFTPIPFLLLISIVFCDGQRHSPYGGVFTPKGKIRSLVVFIGFKDSLPCNPSFTNVGQDVDEWPVDAMGNGLPNYVDPITGECPKLIFSKDEHFQLYQNDPSALSVSKFWHTMSFPEESFRFMGDVFRDKNGKPVRVDIDPCGTASFPQLNRLVVERMREINPDFDLSPFDTRKNYPYFAFDNSDSTKSKPDQKVDFAFFIYRFSSSWSNPPLKGMPRWMGTGGGFASLGSASMAGESGKQGISFAEGFTLPSGGGLPIPLIVHEIAHILYNSPHLFGPNGTVGDYFYPLATGTAATSTLSGFRGFNPWERWYQGFIEPKEIKNDTSITLNDYVPSGDVARVEIPFSKGQHLWVEYRSGKTIFDKHEWAGGEIDKDGSKVPEMGSGAMVLIENTASDRSQIVGALSDKCNSQRYLNAAGNWDYQKLDTFVKNNWANKLYSFKRLRQNAISGTNPWVFYRDDLDKDGEIRLSKDYNSADNEGFGVWINREEVKPGEFQNLYHAFGGFNPKAEGYSRKPYFQEGDFLGMGTNPMPLNIPKYNDATSSLDTTFLNGLEISFSHQTDSQIKVTFKFKRTELKNDFRLTGLVALPNITSDSSPDLIVGRKKRLVLDKSGTVNRHTRTEEGDFINPTVFVVKSGATILLRRRSKLVVADGSSLIIEKGGKLAKERGAKLIVGKNARVVAIE